MAGALAGALAGRAAVVTSAGATLAGSLVFPRELMAAEFSVASDGTLTVPLSVASSSLMFSTRSRRLRVTRRASIVLLTICGVISTKSSVWPLVLDLRPNRPPTTGSRAAPGTPADPRVLRVSNSPPRAIVSPLSTATELDSVRCEMIGLPVEASVSPTVDTSWLMFSVTDPDELMRGVTSKITPVSRNSTVDTNTSSSFVFCAVRTETGI